MHNVMHKKLKGQIWSSVCVYVHIGHTHMCACTRVHRHTRIYFTYICVFQFSVKFNLTFGGRGWMTATENNDINL